AGTDAEIVLGDRVRPPATGVGKDRLPVRERDENQQSADTRGERDDVVDRREPHSTANDKEDLIGSVSNRRDRIRGEDGERGFLAEEFALGTLARQWPADEQILHTFDCGGHSGGAAGTLRLHLETTRI